MNVHYPQRMDVHPQWKSDWASLLNRLRTVADKFLYALEQSDPEKIDYSVDGNTYLWASSRLKNVEALGRIVKMLRVLAVPPVINTEVWEKEQIAQMFSKLDEIEALAQEVIRLATPLPGRPGSCGRNAGSDASGAND